MPQNAAHSLTQMKKKVRISVPLATRAESFHAEALGRGRRGASLLARPSPTRH